MEEKSTKMGSKTVAPIEVSDKADSSKKSENKMIRFNELIPFKDAIASSNVAVFVRIGHTNSPNPIEVQLNDIAQEIKANFS